MAWPAWDMYGYILAGAMLVALAAWIAYLRIDDRLYRTFALLLAIQGVGALLFAWAGRGFSYTLRVGAYLEIALPFVALWFLHLAMLRYGPRPAGPGAPRPDRRLWFLLAGGALLVELLFFYDHGLFYSEGRTGPLNLLAELDQTILALIAFMLARAYLHSGPGAARTALYIASLGFALGPAYTSVFFLVDTAGTLLLDPSFFEDYVGQIDFAILKILDVATLSLILLTVGSLYRRARAARRREDVQAARRYTAVVAIAMINALVVGVFFVATYYRALRVPGPAPPDDPFFVALGLLRTFDAIWEGALAAAFFMGYALTKHRLFDLPSQTRWTIEKGTLVGIFMTLAFVGAEAAKAALDRFADQQGGAWATLVGTLGAGLIVLLAQPLHRLAERMSRRAMPDAKPIKDMTRDERARLFREQVELAWLDGRLQRKERLLLDALRTRLGFSFSEASQIESDVLAHPVARAPRRRPTAT